MALPDKKVEIELHENTIKINSYHKKIDNQIDEKKQISFNFINEETRLFNKKTFKNNSISTTKYNFATWIPKSLILQFQRAANIYFLIISILTFASFSPKSPVSMIGTFSIVLIFTMLKEGYEDIKRYKQDKETNEKLTKIFCRKENKFAYKKWEEICAGDFVIIEDDQDIPADLLLVHSSNETGLCFLETMGLDGETNLKEKMCPSEKIIFSKINNEEIDMNKDINLYFDKINKELQNLHGTVVCDRPNENLEKWSCNLEIKAQNNKLNMICELKQLILKGCKLKNTKYIIGLSIYTGHNTKIMKNAKTPLVKVSNVMRVMNYLLYSVFIFQFVLCLSYSVAYIFWQSNYGFKYDYLYLYQNAVLKSPGVKAIDWFIKYLTFLVAYSHLIPISLYVALELVKLFQSLLISKDVSMFDPTTGKYAIARTSDLIEELGQVEFVFSDKTGTLTKNEMEFRKCYINYKVYGETDKSEKNKEMQKCMTDFGERLNLNNTYTINGDSKAWEILNQNSESEDKESIIDFFTLLAVCHSAYTQEKNGKQTYQSSSPDEIALILGAEQMGFKFIERTSSTIKIKDYKGDLITWDLILELPFDPTRKTMSVILKQKYENEEEQYFMFTKGADSFMLKNIILKQENVDIINHQLGKFAREGLRTLMMGKKTLSKMQVQEYLHQYSQIKRSTDENKDEVLLKYFQDIEKGLNYVGCSAIEDKLQDGVAETIESLMNANIRVWVLTGDKKETAIEIGKTCKLVLSEDEMTQIDLASSENKTLTAEKFIELLEKVYSEYQEFLPDELNPKKIINKPKKKIYMIIDGTNLSFVFQNEKLKKKFFMIGMLANSVICCRVSPAQKSDVVKLAKSNGNWITLSIGDGANDVPMIMEAHIGVGISGKEGTQAVRSADYAISQFRFLKKLLLVHGRWGYRRISLFVYFYFYKNIILVLTEIYFAIYNGFSGEIFFPDMLPLMYNTFWSSWPCILLYSWERDVDEELSMSYPILYRAGQIKYYFNLKNFWIWIFMSILHGLIVFFGVLYGLKYFIAEDGLTKSHWFNSTVAFTTIIHIVTYKLFIQSKYWNKLSLFISIASVFFYYFSVFVLNTAKMAYTFNNELLYTLFDILCYYKCWIIIVCLPFVALIPDFFINWLGYIFFSNPSDIIFQNQELFKNRLKAETYRNNDKLTKLESKKIPNQAPIKLDSSEVVDYSCQRLRVNSHAHNEINNN